MNIVINTAKYSETSISAHTRNSRKIADLLQCELISTHEEAAARSANAYKNFIIVGSAFYPETARIEHWIRQNANAHIVWINNEYSTSPNSEYARLLKDYRSSVITNVEPVKAKGYDSLYNINLNALLYSKPNSTISKKYDICYYGTYRPGRRLYIQEYIQGNAIHYSSSTKNLKKVSQLCGANGIWCKSFSWEKGRETLNLFKYSLYLEDEYTHSNYNYLANRFYEALSCNVVQLFDVNCKNTIEKSGYDIADKYIISSFQEMKERVASLHFESCLQEQQLYNQKAIEEKAQLQRQLQSILSL